MNHQILIFNSNGEFLKTFGSQGKEICQFENPIGITVDKETNNIFVRKLPVIGVSDWLLIYENTLLELSVKDAYDELEISVV